uniref:Uncharacterized protein n=1 Tax=Equus caballus TaxID=9796 RepID=A0A9L0RQP8_HORSE
LAPSCPSNGCSGPRGEAGMQSHATHGPLRAVFSWLTQVTKMNSSLGKQLPLQKMLVPTRSISVRGQVAGPGRWSPPWWPPPCPPTPAPPARLPPPRPPALWIPPPAPRPDSPSKETVGAQRRRASGLRAVSGLPGDAQGSTRCVSPLAGHKVAHTGP